MGIRATALLMLLVGCASAGAQESKVHVLALPRLPLHTALRELGKQMGITIATLDRSERLVGPLQGSYTAESALTTLLADSGFAFARASDGTFDVWAVMVRPPSSPQSRADEQIAPARGPLNDHHRSFLEQVTVTGARMRGTLTGPVPVKIFDGETIRNPGAISLPDLLKNLPQQPYVRPEGFRADGAQFAELRGLGATVVLINGRWAVPTAGNPSYEFDLNTIPLSAVESVEVLASPSSVFGAHAIGGIVNVVLKRDIEEPTAEIYYGTAKGGAGERRASLSTGYSQGPLRTTLVMDYFQRESLQGVQRALWRDQDYRRFGSYDWRASDGNISSATGWNLPGLPSGFAAIPVDGASTPEDFESTAGTRNVVSEYQFVSIVPAATRKSAMASLELKLPGGADAFAELLYSDRATEFQYGPPRLSGVLVPATNAFNLFGVPVRSDFLLKGIDNRSTETQMSLKRLVFGLRGQLGEAHWELSVLRSEEAGTICATNQLDQSLLAAALASPDPARALNVFQDGPGGSPELLASLVYDSLGQYSSAGTQASAFVHGPLFALPGGTASVVVGGEWRRESVLSDERALTSLSRIVSAAYAEMQLPLTRATQLSLAGRFDDYSDWGYSFNPQYGFVWEPAASLRLRLSYSTSFRPPSMHELGGNATLVRGQIADPRRRNEVASVAVRTGGNAELDPTVAATWMASASWKPKSLPDLRLSLDYWRIRMGDRIRVIPISELLADEAFYADRVVRAEPTVADIAAGLPGALQAIDMTPANAGRLVTSGIDIGFSNSLHTDVGDFTAKVAATWVDKFDTAGTPGAPLTHRAGVASPLGTIARWRAVGSLEWHQHWMTLWVNTRYVAAYDDVNSSGRNGRVVPSQTIVDLHASLDVGEFVYDSGLLRDVEITAGVLNVFDRPPAFAEVGSAAGYDLSQGDLRQRFGYVRIAKKF